MASKVLFVSNIMKRANFLFKIKQPIAIPAKVVQKQVQ
jgi:hypothetical protein